MPAGMNAANIVKFCNNLSSPILFAYTLNGCSRQTTDTRDEPKLHTVRHTTHYVRGFECERKPSQGLVQKRELRAAPRRKTNFASR